MTYHFPPKLMQAKAAAHYMGVSLTKFLGLGISGKRDGGNVLYDRDDLDAYADSLPYDVANDEVDGCDAADTAFGKPRN